MVHSIIFDEKKNKAIGVNVIDSESKEMMEFYAKIIFVNAAAMNTNLVLLNSKSGRFPDGIGNDSGALGKYVAFRNYRARVSADFDGLQDMTSEGRKPSGGYIQGLEMYTNKRRISYVAMLYLWRRQDGHPPFRWYR